jgi:hypothetical protein
VGRVMFCRRRALRIGRFWGINWEFRNAFMRNDSSQGFIYLGGPGAPRGLIK